MGATNPRRGPLAEPVWTTATLLRDYSSWQIRRAVSSGRLVKLRRGWYAQPNADPAMMRAVAAGGVLSCVSALERWGVWTSRTATLHVRRGAREAGAPPLGLKWCSGHLQRRWAQNRACDEVLPALTVAATCCQREEWIASAESAIHLGLITASELRAARLHLPARALPWLAWLERSESGTERYASDRLRDQRALLLGYHTVRLTWEQVMLTWGETWQTLNALVKARVHHRRANSRFHPTAA